MMRLGQGIYTWSRFSAEKEYNFNGFLFSTPDVTLVVNPPPFTEDDLAYFGKLDLWPDLLVITDRNHLRAREWFAEKRYVATAMHEAEAEHVDIDVERRLEDGESLRGGWTVVHLPGKSPGEIGLHWPEQGILMLGDALIAPEGVLSLIPAAKLDDPLRFKESLQKIRNLSFDTLLLANGESILKGAKKRVETFILPED